MSPRSMAAQPMGTLPEPSLHPVERAILRTVAYADVFDYPLTEGEVHRYLVGLRASRSVVQDVLKNGLLARHCLSSCEGYVTLPGRETIVPTRRAREAISAEMWRVGIHYGRAIASLPFVRAVAITGALAVRNVGPDADIDYLIVTTPHRVWLTRSLVLVFVRLGRLAGVTICPNYVISVDSLGQFERSFFAAHELAQMVPLYGLDVYREILSLNPWAGDVLPNAFDDRRDVRQHLVRPVSRRLKRSAESILAGRAGDAWERRESRIKIRRLSEEAQACGTCAANFTPEQCKGHIVDHGRLIREAYAERLQRVGLDADGDGIIKESPVSVQLDTAGR